MKITRSGQPVLFFFSCEDDPCTKNNIGMLSASTPTPIMFFLDSRRWEERSITKALRSAFLISGARPGAALNWQTTFHMSMVLNFLSHFDAIKILKFCYSCSTKF